MVAVGAGALPAFSSSVTSSAAFRAGTPNGEAAGPERKVITPIFTAAGSCAKTEIGATANAATTAVASFLRPRMISSPRYCLGLFVAIAARAATLLLVSTRIILHQLVCLVKQATSQELSDWSAWPALSRHADRGRVRGNHQN